jgi:hypothetical protein
MMSLSEGGWGNRGCLVREELEDIVVERKK